MSVRTAPSAPTEPPRSTPDVSSASRARPTPTLPDNDVCYRAVAGRDPRFDGWIYVGVTSTGIYCRPSCPAKTPKQSNCRFFAVPGAAQQAGFRACRRCRPDAVPGSPQWNPRADVAGRAMRLIADGLVDRAGVSGLAAAVGYSERQLNRLLLAEVGAGPLAIARAQRAQTARVLIENSRLPMADVAFAAGFASVRQFNDSVREVYGRPPSALRRGGAGAATAEPAGPTTISLRLPVRQPFAGDHVHDFLATRAIDGVEAAGGSSTGDRLRYVRSIRLSYGVGLADVTVSGEQVSARLQLEDLRDLASAVSRLRLLLDLDADPEAIDAGLAADPMLAELINARPGVRVPGVVDPHELAVRALLGQQISISGAATCAAKITARYGRPLPAPFGADLDDELRPRRLFPAAADLAEADPETLPMPRARGRALVGLATALASGRLDLCPGANREESRAGLLALPGIGPWTAGYVAMRALGDPDVLLTDDLIIRRELQRRGVEPEGRPGWAPWRSYATMRLWQASRWELAA